MFSAYPDEWQGVGLLLLRVAAAAVLVAQGVASFSYKNDPGPVLLAVSLLATAAGALLLLGLLTRFATIVAALGALGSMFSGFLGPRVGLFETRMTTALGVAIAAAILFLGPGAYSLDAKLFGLREVIIPQTPDDHS